MSGAAAPSSSTASPHERCESYVKDVLANVNTVAYLVDAIKRLGREITLADIKCVSNKTVLSQLIASQPPQQQAAAAAAAAAADARRQQAGYMWADTKLGKKGTIVLLEEMLRERDDVERALRHELIHAFDDARGEIEPTNCYHQACSEVRAARLSGDCFVAEEVKRGRVGTISGRDCVMRRATLAVEGNPLCKGFGPRAVEVVMPRCYRDFEPFVAPVFVMGNANPEGKPY